MRANMGSRVAPKPSDSPCHPNVRGGADDRSLLRTQPPALSRWNPDNGVPLDQFIFPSRKASRFVQDRIGDTDLAEIV